MSQATSVWFPYLWQLDLVYPEPVGVALSLCDEHHALAGGEELLGAGLVAGELGPEAGRDEGAVVLHLQGGLKAGGLLL